jgi:LCP family protein required for cell wall assembly
MKRGSPAGSSPRVGEIALATILGVLIGLTITSYNRRNHIFASGQGLSRLSAQQPNTNGFGNGFSNAFGALTNMSGMQGISHRTNILLMGVDSNGPHTKRFTNTRSDTMMVVSVDPESKRVGVVSIPRDSLVEIADGRGKEDKINSAHALGGPDLAVKTVQDVFSVPIDHYVVVDVKGLKRLFEILGPVDVLVEKNMNYTDHAAGLHVALSPGLQSLDATEAEEYVRFRHDAKGDIGRIDRQQWFLRQVSKKLREPQVILKLPDLFKCATDFVATDLTIEEMAYLAAFAKDLHTEKIETAIVPGESACIKGGSYWVPDMTRSAIVFNRICGVPLDSAIATDSLPDNGDGPGAVEAAELPKAPKPMTAIIKYGRGSDETAKILETQLTKAGYKVRSRIRVDVSDCQHEQIIQSSKRFALGENLEKLQVDVATLQDFPSVINLDAKAPYDLIVVVGPDTTIKRM